MPIGNGMDALAIVPAPLGTDAYTELAADGSPGVRRFRKHILNLGTLIHPKTGEKISLDDKFYADLARNFNAGVVDHVTVPLADDNNRHSEDPLRNAGQVVGLHRDGQKIYVDMDIRDPSVAEKIANKTILGTSAFLHLNYKDTRTGEPVGAALLHSCLTNRPHVLGLEPYREIVAASADFMDQDEPPIVLAQEVALTKDEMLAALKNEHGIDVAALQDAATAKTDMAQLTAALTEALKPAGGQVGLTEPGSESIELSDVIGAVAELAEKNVALSGAVVDLRRQRAEDQVDSYIREGRVLPKQKSVFVELALTNTDMLEQLLPDAPVVALNNSIGTAGTPHGEQRHEIDIDAEIAKLTASHSEFFTRDGRKAGK